MPRSHGELELAAVGVKIEQLAVAAPVDGRSQLGPRLVLDEAVAESAIPPLDTATAASAWFGAVNEVVIHWALAEQPGRLEDAYPTIRALLLRGVQAGGVDKRVS